MPFGLKSQSWEVPHVLQDVDLFEAQRDVSLYFISTRKFSFLPSQRFYYLTSTYLSYPLELTREMHRLVSGRQFWCPLQMESPIPTILLRCPNTVSELLATFHLAFETLHVVRIGH